MWNDQKSTARYHLLLDACWGFDQFTDETHQLWTVIKERKLNLRLIKTQCRHPYYRHSSIIPGKPKIFVSN